MKQSFVFLFSNQTSFSYNALSSLYYLTERTWIYLNRTYHTIKWIERSDAKRAKCVIFLGRMLIILLNFFLNVTFFLKFFENGANQMSTFLNKCQLFVRFLFQMLHFLREMYTFCTKNTVFRLFFTVFSFKLAVFTVIGPLAKARWV